MVYDSQNRSDLAYTHIYCRYSVYIQKYTWNIKKEIFEIVRLPIKIIIEITPFLNEFFFFSSFFYYNGTFAENLGETFEIFQNSFIQFFVSEDELRPSEFEKIINLRCYSTFNTIQY